MAGAVVLGVCATAAPAGADRANDQQIADNSVLTADDVPGFDPHSNQESTLPDAPECQGLEAARKQLEAAPNKEVEFRTPSNEQVVDNQVSVLASTRRAKQTLRAYRGAKADDCFVAAFTASITGQDGGVDVTIDVSPSAVDVGTNGVAYDVRATATEGDVSKELFTTVAVVRVGRAIAAFGLGDSAETVPPDVARGLIELVTERLQEAL
jgi:hypothetical protein